MAPCSIRELTSVVFGFVVTAQQQPQHQQQNNQTTCNIEPELSCTHLDNERLDPETLFQTYSDLKKQPLWAQISQTKPPKLGQN